jgi:sarcosine oxidase gamma subunit
MKKISQMGVMTTFALALIIIGPGKLNAQQTTTTAAGSPDASITTSRTTQTPQARPLPRPTSTPVTPVRPLTEEERTRQEASSARRRQEASSGDPDVLLDVPNLSVDEITLEVENLKAKVSLDARLANLLSLSAGADVGIDKVKLTIKGVKAEVLLKVRLDNVAQIIDRTLTTIDRNPEILTRLLQSVDNTVGTVGGVAQTALQPGGVLSQTINTLGQTVQRTVDTTGNIVEKTLDATGNIVNSNTVGNVSSLRVLTETKSGGQIIRRVQDTAGGVIELTLDSAGKVINSKVLSQGSAPRQ